MNKWILNKSIFFWKRLALCLHTQFQFHPHIPDLITWSARQSWANLVETDHETSTSILIAARGRQRNAVHGTAAELLRGWAGVQSAHSRQGNETPAVWKPQIRGQTHGCEHSQNRRTLKNGACWRRANRRKQTDKDEDNSEMSAFYAHVVCENAFISIHSGVILGTPREKASGRKLEITEFKPDTSNKCGTRRRNDAAGRTGERWEERSRPTSRRTSLKKRRDVVGLHFRGMPKIYLYMSRNITVEVPLNSMSVKMKWDVSELCLITA